MPRRQRGFLKEKIEWEIRNLDRKAG